MKAIALLALVSICMNASSAQSDFWTWFKEKESEFPATAEFGASYGKELSRRLALVHPGLVYEISVPENGPKELVISADGLRNLIPHVRNLVGAAPAVEGWTFTAFRPRMKDYAKFKLRFGGREFDPGKLWCYSRVQGGRFDLIVYHPAYSDEARNLIMNGTYILLDMALGEFDVMTGIRSIDHQQLPENPESKGLYRFERLRQIFDDHKRK